MQLGEHPIDQPIVRLKMVTAARLAAADGCYKRTKYLGTVLPTLLQR